MAAGSEEDTLYKMIRLTRVARPQCNERIGRAGLASSNIRRVLHEGIEAAELDASAKLPEPLFEAFLQQIPSLAGLFGGVSVPTAAASTSAGTKVGMMLMNRPMIVLS